MKHIFIINPTAGKTNAAQKLIPKLQQAKEQPGTDLVYYLTEHSGHAIELAKNAVETLQEGEELRLYACGGDGTLNEVLCGAYHDGPRKNVAVGHIPCGSGNDMLRNFGTAEDFSDITRMIQGSTRTIDLIEANGRLTASICAAGLDAKVTHNLPFFRRLPLCGGSVAYDLSVLVCLFGKMGYHMTAEYENGTFEGEYLLLAIGNGSYYGGGYYCLPQARVDDGVLNAVLVKKMPLMRMVSMLNVYKAGKHIDENGEVVPEYRDVMTILATQKIRISCDRDFYYVLDGEVASARQLDVRVLPNAAQFILPAGL